MSVSRIISIPSPVLPLSPAGTFDWEIKNSSDTVVDSGTCTNTPFTVSGLTGDDYRLFATYNGNTSIWCFTVTECSCPTVSGAVIEHIEVGGSTLHYLTISFDIMDDDFPTCPFTIKVHGGFVDEVDFTINSFADLTFISGTTWQRKILISSDSTTYQIINGAGIPCGAPVNVSFECIAYGQPQIWGIHHHEGVSLTRWINPAIGGVGEIISNNIFFDGTNWKMRLRFPDCGVSCHTFDIVLSETTLFTSGAPEFSSRHIVLDCDGTTYPLEVDIILHPTGISGISPGGIQYFINTEGDCCSGSNGSELLVTERYDY